MHQFINGKLQPGTSGQSLDVINPATSEVVESVGLASLTDLESAVAAARSAFPAWSRTAPGERAGILQKFARIMEERKEEFCRIESSQTGKPLRLTREFDVPGTIDNIDFFAGAARHLEGKATAEYSPHHTSSIRREPIGVVGSIAPWNYPLQMAAWKILPAIAAGNTIILKPAEITPLTALMFAQALSDAGLPDGVVNVVVGDGATVGAALMRHPNVDMVSFTGSTAIGRTVLEAAAVNAKRVHLELGGKAPFVVFDDANLDAAVHGAVAGSLINTGQDCTAATRAIVHRSVYEEFVAKLAARFEGIVLGAPGDTDVDLGPLVSFKQRDHVAGMVERARSYSKIVAGGYAPIDGRLEKGAFYRPTVVVDAAPDSEIVRDEVFGPVLVVLPFDTDDEAIQLANHTVYGLAASAWTNNLQRALRATREIKAGCVWVNDHVPIISEMPHGGFKQSGFGKDMSAYSFEEYTQVKHVMFELDDVTEKNWHRTIFDLR
ncbi:gamma-aminobutyraldehyde dehydrogenase [Paenarthrobacter nitroguajacolicus]|uniref:Gamma-aminobutyraldehyde dehydrogenase n=1 Tax=Paenarthrobacter nitroguajacolicus TaxID=211146 RepID=A0A558GWG6_PAENT|nr:gamma-aminobutyraldehyde dehydrogenase [Paenarthrobacter nitroguajacolicus]TVU61222.1 gamma-aminobutyraldehyde dehydrogenase [Paenarthrobacter nitroguajacolicus]